MIIKFITENITTRVLELFAEKKDEFEIFYEQFSKIIKPGLHEYSTNNQKLARLLRFYSTQSLEQLTSFDEYVRRMKPEQKGIYWISAETQNPIEMSLMFEYFQQKGIEVLFLIDLINED
jgi:molecular chaperone HtpG